MFDMIDAKNQLRSIYGFIFNFVMDENLVGCADAHGFLWQNLIVHLQKFDVSYGHFLNAFLVYKCKSKCVSDKCCFLLMPSPVWKPKFLCLIWSLSLVSCPRPLLTLTRNIQHLLPLNSLSLCTSAGLHFSQIFDDLMFLFSSVLIFAISCTFWPEKRVVGYHFFFLTF